jgi:effector-binding domain-containing protein
MIEAPQILRLEARPTATLRLLVPREEIRNVMGPGIREVMGAIVAQGLTPTQPWCTHHFRRPTDTFDFEICVPVNRPVQPIGRVRPGEWPAMTVARTVYHGPYEGLAAAWPEFLSSIETLGHPQAEDLWESYLVGPETRSNPADWRTELIRPLEAMGSHLDC